MNTIEAKWTELNLPIKGVVIGDRFKTGKHTTAKVIDILEVRSIVTEEIKGHICFAQAEGLAHNAFEVPFSTVVRNKIKQA